MTNVAEAYARSNVRTALALQLPLLPRAGLHQFEALVQAVPNSMVKGFQLGEAPKEA